MQIVLSVAHRSVCSWHEDPAVGLSCCDGSCGGCPLCLKLTLELVNLSGEVGGDGGGLFGGNGVGFLFDLVGSGGGLFRVDSGACSGSGGSCDRCGFLDRGVRSSGGGGGGFFGSSPLVRKENSKTTLNFQVAAVPPASRVHICDRETMR